MPPSDAAVATPGGAGAERPSLLAFVVDAESDAVLREALLSEAGEGAEVRRGDLQAAARALRKGITPRALVVDVSGLDQPLTALEELSQVVEPDVRVLVVGERQDASFYRQVTRGLGVLEYLYKPLSHEMVARHFAGFVRGAAEASPDVYLRGGRVIAVTGVRGGVGATTVASNLAWHLAEQARRHTALLDCDLHGGSTALLLGAKTTNGLRVALEHPDRVDELFVERTAQPVGERLFVLAAEEKLLDEPHAVPGATSRLVNMLRRRFNFVVVDLPARATLMSRDVLDLAHQRVLVTDPSLAGAREVLRYAGLPNAPMQARRALIVLNRANQTGGLNRQQMVQALGSEPDLQIPWLPKLVPAAADLGEPAAAKRSGFRDGIEQLAREVASVGSAEPAAKRGLFRKLFA
ncbi:AAA family ATPase [Roseomonas sp. BN140053]|uniref:AAA family ATPase n=1 Tax=Roseomonas sp. BN140053 TaxID=3391898 RepID=UPI0039E7BA4F